jgi:predicted nucleic acid-binding protein
MSITVVNPVRRLAQYRPFERGGLDLRAVLYDLILAVAAIGDGEVGSLLECRRSFIDCWGLEVEVDELRPVVTELIETGMAESTGKGFRLSAELMANLDAKAREWQRTEDRAMREWELAARQVNPAVSDEDMELLRSDLREWLHQIITRHGAEAALMLYPEDDRARRFFEEVDSRGFELLPERESGVRSLREQALPLFIRSPTPDQRRFLAGLLNTSFYMTVLTIDVDAKQLVQAQMEGHRIYVDTNFLYAVLGAASAEEVYSSRRLVQLSKDLGISFAVTPWTMNELRTSIARSRRDIEHQQRFIRPELAETMLRVSGDKGFNRLFWQVYRDKKTQPKDVFDRLEHFERDLASYGIVEVSQGCRAIDQQKDRVNVYSSLLNAERWPYQKEWVVLEHDAKCRLLVERLRGDGNIGLSNARYWFLTYDAKLPRFAERVPDNGDEAPELPFCISPSAWVQIIRALTPRTEDFDRTVVDLLTSPFVGYRRAVDAAVLQEVVGRMDHFEDASPEMAVAILTDTAKVSEIEHAVSTQDEDKVEEAVRTAYSAKGREMQEAVEASEQRVAEAERARLEAEARAATLEADRARQREEAATQLQGHRDEWKGEKETLKDQMAELERSRDDATKKTDRADERIKTMEVRLEEHDKRKTRNRRVAVGLAFVALGLAVGLGLSLLVFTDDWAIGGAVVGGVALVLLGVRIAAGKQWGGEVVVGGSLIAAVGAIVVAIILDSN